MGGNSVKSDLFEFGNVSSLEEVVIDGRGVEMVRNSVDKDELTSESSVLNFFEEGVIKSRNVGPGFIFNCRFTTVSISRLVTEHNM